MPLAMGLVVRLSKVGLDQLSVARVKITNNKYDAFFKAFWPEDSHRWAHANTHELQEGDTVVIRESEAPLTREVDSEVVRVVYRAGRLHDPLSDRPVTAAVEYEDRAAARARLVKAAFQEGAQQRSFDKIYQH